MDQKQPTLVARTTAEEYLLQRAAEHSQKPGVSSILCSVAERLHNLEMDDASMGSRTLTDLDTYPSEERFPTCPSSTPKQPSHSLLKNPLSELESEMALAEDRCNILQQQLNDINAVAELAKIVPAVGFPTDLSLSESEPGTALTQSHTASAPESCIEAKRKGKKATQSPVGLQNNIAGKGDVEQESWCSMGAGQGQFSYSVSVRSTRGDKSLKGARSWTEILQDAAAAAKSSAKSHPEGQSVASSVAEQDSLPDTTIDMRGTKKSKAEGRSTHSQDHSRNRSAGAQGHFSEGPGSEQTGLAAPSLSADDPTKTASTSYKTTRGGPGGEGGYPQAEPKVAEGDDSPHTSTEVESIQENVDSAYRIDSAEAFGMREPEMYHPTTSIPSDGPGVSQRTHHSSALSQRTHHSSALHRQPSAHTVEGNVAMVEPYSFVGESSESNIISSAPLISVSEVNNVDMPCDCQGHHRPSPSVLASAMKSRVYQKIAQHRQGAATKHRAWRPPGRSCSISQRPLDPIDHRGFALPTKASLLKRSAEGASEARRRRAATRHYRLRLRDLPFVLGSAIGPSHHVGTNVQQVLAMMKTHQRPLCRAAGTACCYPPQAMPGYNVAAPLPPPMVPSGGAPAFPALRNVRGFNSRPHFKKPVATQVYQPSAIPPKVNKSERVVMDDEWEEADEEEEVVLGEVMPEKNHAVPQAAVKSQASSGRVRSRQPNEAKDQQDRIKEQVTYQYVRKRRRELRNLLQVLTQEFAHLNGNYKELQKAVVENPDVVNRNDTQEKYGKLMEDIGGKMADKEEQISTLNKLYGDMKRMHRRLRQRCREHQDEASKAADAQSRPKGQAMVQPRVVPATNPAGYEDGEGDESSMQDTLFSNGAAQDYSPFHVLRDMKNIQDRLTGEPQPGWATH